MRKLLFTLICLFAMMAAGMGLKAQEIMITLNPGWTWIGYTNAEAMSISAALGTFVPMEGDILKSKYSSTTYSNGQWRGRLQQFTPGLGYHYYSMRGEPVSFVFANSTPQSQVTVTTSEPLLITAISAMGGGEVTTNDGTYIITKGLCWATHENPTTNDDFYQEAESGVGNFTISMTGLNIGTTYYVRAYAVTPNGMVYGDQKSFTTRDGIPEVSTAAVTNIAATRANCGGMVTDNGGLNVIARGVCWSTEHNPTINDSHTTDDSGLGSFSSAMTGMNENTNYYVRAYASTSHGTGYGEELSFTTQNSSVGLYVDLGLPSGLQWATCNVGAETPEDYGDFFSWGETQPKSGSDFYCDLDYLYYYIENFGGWEGTEEIIYITKYCNDPGYGDNGFADYLTVLLPEDDAATANWGAGWRMPTKEEWQELFENTTSTWTTQNGVRGRVFTAANGNSIFLPAAGYRNDDCFEGGWPNLVWFGIYGGYWSSSLRTGYPFNAWGGYFNSSNFATGNYSRENGRSVRAVRPSSYVVNAIANPTEGGTVSGSGVYQDGQSCTVTATANNGYAFVYWTEYGSLVSFDASYSFTVNENWALVANFAILGEDGHNYIDLGLPSSIMWATCNIGADSPEEYGDYFAWGETQPKDAYDWTTYQYCNGSYNTLTKYCNNSSYGYDGFTDNLTTLLPEDDAATANWGAGWRMPTKQEWQELFNNTTCPVTTVNGLKYKLFTASNGNMIILPLAGYWYSNLSNAEINGDYWSSSLGSGFPDSARYLFFYYNAGSFSMGNKYRNYGLSVRAVRSASQN